MIAILSIWTEGFNIALEMSTLEYARAWLKVEATGQLPPQVFGEDSPQVGDRVQVVLALESWAQCYKTFYIRNS